MCLGFLGRQDLDLLSLSFEFGEERVDIVLDVGDGLLFVELELHVSHRRAHLLGCRARHLHLLKHVSELLNFVLVLSE